MLHLDQGIYYGLNAVGARVWQLLQEPRMLDEIVQRLVAEFEVSREQCLEDVRELVSDLRRHELVTVTEASD